jgi:hypothetical protein
MMGMMSLDEYSSTDWKAKIQEAGGTYKGVAKVKVSAGSGELFNKELLSGDRWKKKHNR